jgi:3-deoxy-7-phosphoheptulonate synthase
MSSGSLDYQLGRSRGRADWEPGSWRTHPAAQEPPWPDLDELKRAEARLCGLPPLIVAGEARRLKDQLADVAAGKAFLLQAGDCAESFNDASAESILDKLKVILQMSIVLTYATGVPVVKVGRIAGQFAKPRTLTHEEIDGVELECFRGHMVNDEAFDVGARTPDPWRLVTAYEQSVATLNLLRAFTKGGFADLHRVHQWNQEFVATSQEGRRYTKIADEIARALTFMRACGIDLKRESALSEVDFYTSHEALILHYEEALTRRDPLSADWYDCSAHLVWVGERTRQLDGAHIEFASGIANPLAVKLGPAATPLEAVAIAERLDPDRTPGRLTFVSRMGAGLVTEALPPIVAAVRDEGHPVVWACDPMHGNTITADNGRKTRRFDDILRELRGFFSVHRELGTWAGGVHVELTGAEVTECLGGAEAIAEVDLDANYTTMCDPRLNARQSLDLAFQVSELLRQEHPDYLESVSG